MKFAYFPGCKIPFELEEYGRSFKAIMKKLGVDLIDLPFNCCGYPSRSKSLEISVLSSIRNLALAQKNGLDIITPCKCCFGQFKHAIYFWNNHIDLRIKIDAILKKEGLAWTGETQIKHLLSFLHDDLGLRELKQKITRPFSNKKIAVQYGCHALRPFSVTGFDDPHAPRIFEALVNITGFKIVEWSKSTECCGNPIYETNKKLSLKILESKLKAASETGAAYICNACTHCQIQYNVMDMEQNLKKFNIIPVLFTQILGISMGLSRKDLGININL
ncbi:MAG: CoB--CoM heterodisulfide reductase iron-sulfur subunit B family protein [Desulfobacula sp.]|jgi:heterodisulfide reductase subunit B|uniref:CoB--CoM heterodisulfide reductase iron-sulfur subunit B family protein n=1 Tax=Desulfobacula sp. TaxID=2593537 RepID=UPI001DB82FCC|nr:CoB--CoM heterodisulfide reductase iron-sulfur subunit B family protein [Desulfobacula sp.]MBT3487229.1 CoB--CoM heterodisulfide reductase iron-sulfur subunit B family protein [Desulfobacula sp.]MBT3806820.1 CoB--CoM heterodisulfide reductase iron-sulfur subunit B family protein [Desulfobacula sp.]MBT4027128.1 CoB--CoM heterodisulfide reductase iron-sulfur subunit B family protein [Desulfobacula sp.]MBT4200854.1 CoB--CoM heterodisulfide reductase iron-sulfur subunit B family protein [Desulfo